ncbi:DUF2304 domain-containing protein [Clostridium mediterraneense]|uniref:DUF2304 domain-containing protein n=1 Tax=Clostridium mediterraneense TaxID=1805472 RepID=UPI000836AD49|nr:DUF2304 domain-containing protein [Clostridium mediterraneense]
MNEIFQIILIIASCLFTLYIISITKRSKLTIKYSMLWIVLGIFFIVLSICPGIVYSVSRLLRIYNPVNTLFLGIIFILILILFTLSVAISKLRNQVTSLSQELGILKKKVDERD